MTSPHASIVAMLEATVAGFADRAAVVFGETTWTYAQLRRIVRGLARELGNQGGRIATLLPNSLLACATPYAAAAAGAQLVPLNPLYTARELEYMLRDATPRMLIADDALVDRVQPVLEGCTLVRASELAARFATWLAQADESLPLPDPDADGLLQYTGGSSGFPKGVILTNRALATNIAQRESLLPVPPGRERVLCVMPLFHSYAMAMGLFLCGHSGSTLVVHPGYHPQRVLDAIGHEGITIFPGSPTIFTGLMQHEGFARTDWSRVHTCYSGSAALSRETLERWQAATGAAIYEGYGQTEAGPVLSFNPQRGPVKVGSVGIAVADTELQVVDLEEGTRVLPPGGRGEIRARGPQIMRGYLNLPV